MLYSIAFFFGKITIISFFLVSALYACAAMYYKRQLEARLHYQRCSRIMFWTGMVLIAILVLLNPFAS